LVGPSKFPRWAAKRRLDAYRVLFSWPQSLGGWVSDDRTEPVWPEGC
jgi:hypothetical protein